MANSHVLIQSQTLSGTSSQVDFNSVSGYRDLRLVATILLSTNGTQSWVRINGDTGSNYSENGATGYGASSYVGWADATATKITTMRATGLASGNYQLLTVDIMDASATDKHKTVLARSNHPGEVSMLSSRWANTAAVTSVSLLPETGTFAAGSTFVLYGVAS